MHLRNRPPDAAWPLLLLLSNQVHPKVGEVLAYLAPRLAPPPKRERVWAGMPPRPPILPAPELDDLLPPTVNELKLNSMSTGWTTSVRASGPPFLVVIGSFC